MGYTAIVKNVGVLYGFWSILGAALGVAVCPVGGGDSELFSRITGLDVLEEGSVGEMVLWGR